jgi:hypothetical protein
MMKTILPLLAMTMIAVQALAFDSLPPDVRQFIDRREGCEHMRSEISDLGDRQRIREVNRELRKLCAGTDKQLARLKKRYAANAPVTRRLREFDENIEPRSVR